MRKIFILFSVMLVMILTVPFAHAGTISDSDQQVKKGMTHVSLDLSLNVELQKVDRAVQVKAKAIRFKHFSSCRYKKWKVDRELPTHIKSLVQKTDWTKVLFRPSIPIYES